MLDIDNLDTGTFVPNAQIFDHKVEIVIFPNFGRHPRIMVTLVTLVSLVTLVTLVTLLTLVSLVTLVTLVNVPIVT